MLIKKNGLDLIFGHDVHTIFENINTPEAFEHLKKTLSADYPELADISADSTKSWIKQAARKLDIPYETLIEELESQMLRSYLINKTYQEMVAKLNDPNVSLLEKEKLSPGITAKIVVRHLRMTIYGMVKAFQFTIVTSLITALFTLPLMWLFQFHPIFVISFFCGAYLTPAWLIYNQTAEEKIADEAYKILSGGDGHV